MKLFTVQLPQRKNYKTTYTVLIIFHDTFILVPLYHYYQDKEAMKVKQPVSKQTIDHLM